MIRVVPTSRAARPTALVVALAALAALGSGPSARAQDGADAAADSAAPSAAEDGPVATSAELRARRDRAAAAAGPDAAVLVLRPSTVDGVPGTERNPDFEYLCSVEARRAALLIAAPAASDGAAGSPAADGRIDRLYLPLRNPAGERWTGPEPGPDPATARAEGFDDARSVEQLGEDVAALLRTRTRLYVSFGRRTAGGEELARILSRARDGAPGRWIRIVDLPGGDRDDVADALRRALPSAPSLGPPDAALERLVKVDVLSADSLLGEMREVKSPAELAAIRRATEASLRGHADAMRVARAGLHEYDLAAVVELRCREGGCRRQAYPSIVGAGPNSCVLHYDRNRRRLEDGDLVVLDAGGEYEGYATDVTRTFPVSGTFTEEQAKAYDAVLEAQEAALAAVRPGVTLRQVHEVARSTLERHGLARWFIHGTCHTVGLEVHDSWRRDAVLREGCVITVEPGVYDPSRNLGIRIEDTVVVTADGCENLSASLPKRREDIEALMREEPPAGLPR